MQNLFSVIRQNPLGLFAVSWASLLLVFFLKIFPVPSTVTGFGWLLEICLATLLLITLTGLVWRGKKLFDDISAREFYLIILPCAGFIAWSFASCFWAEATRSALHHSLLWASYLIAYLLFRGISHDSKNLSVTFYSLSIIVGILAFLCIFDYFAVDFGNWQSIGNFRLRFAKYSELFVAILPVFVILALKLNKKKAFFYGIISSLLFWGILLSLSKAALLAGISGLICLALAFFYVRRNQRIYPRLIVLGAVFAGLFAFTQISFNSSPNATTLERISSKDDVETASSKHRILIWQTSREMFSGNIIFGVGADNFGLNYNEYRARFSAKNSPDSALNAGEDVMSERAHNEFFQIFAELGVIGAFFFLWFIGGIGYAGFFAFRARKVSPFTIGTIAGIVAFMISSAFSSFSFRFVPSSLIFFFLLAILAREAFHRTKKVRLKPIAFTPHLQSVFASLALVVTFGLFGLSALRGTSYYFTAQAERMELHDDAEKTYEIARFFDAEQGSSDISQGLRLYKKKRPAEAVYFLQSAINKGIDLSACYSWLASAQAAAGDTEGAKKTLAEAVRIFPHSVFVQTKYAAFLEKHGKLNEAEKHFEIALQLNKRDAVIWRVAITEGFEQAGRIGKRDFGGFAVMDLNPPPAIYAVNDEQTIYKKW